MKSLIELYKSIQASVGMTSDSQGFVSTVLPGGGAAKPYTIDGKRLVLPLPEQLNQPDWSGRIGFHPFLQKVKEGESRVVEKFRDRMNSYADFMTGALLVDIAKLAFDDTKHMDLTPTQAKYLGPFKNADGKFVKFLVSMVTAPRVNKKNLEFVRFSLIKGRTWQGKKRSRVAVLHFPLYEALPKDGKGTTVLGHKLRITDVRMLLDMYEFLFPGINEKEHWEVASDSLIAASMESLMTLYGRYTDVHNSAVEILADHTDTSTELLIVNDWRDDIAKLPEYLPEIRKIPWLEGAEPSRIEATTAPSHISINASKPQERIAPSPTATTPVVSAGAIPATFVLNNNEPQQMQQNQEAPAPRFKFGVKANTVSNNTNERQIPHEQANPTTIGYQRSQPTVGASYYEPKPQQLQQPQQYMNQPQQQPQAPQAMKVPETARLVNGQLFIPVESTGVSALPPQAVLVDGKVYVPLAGAMGAPMPGVGMPGAVMMNRGAVMPGYSHAPVTDPSQVPGLSQQEIDYYRVNPVMFQNYLGQLQSGAASQVQQAAVARQNSVPRYLRNAVEQAQQNQFSTNNRGFFNR